MLSLLPEKSDVPGAVALDDLIELLAVGGVDVCGTMSSAFDFAATKAVTWSDLYYAGALTYDCQSPGTLRIANSEALSLIHSSVDTFFADRHELRWTFLDTCFDFTSPQSFLELLSKALHDLALRSFDRSCEPNLRGIFELVIRNCHCKTSSRPVDPFILLPADNTCFKIPAYLPEKVFIAVNPNHDEPTVEALETLHEELVGLEEAELLARPYSVWSPTLGAMETVPVGSFLDSEPDHQQFLAVGGAPTCVYLDNKTTFWTSSVDRELHS
ncbi:hypothetical protein B0H12DRAFT_1116814 [Mycena haematopus]|nr:hypothetical protein B0H12DRAFT_1116814 [Mycena haematopus]